MDPRNPYLGHCSKKASGWVSPLKVDGAGAFYQNCPECGLIHRPGKPEDNRKNGNAMQEETHPSGHSDK